MINVTPLDVLRSFVGWMPWHWHQLSDPIYTPIQTECSTIVLEQAYLGMDMAGRADMRRKLASAEEKLREFLRYPPVPMWREATIPYTRGPIQLPDGYLLDLGAKTETLLGSVALTFLDQDSDNLAETFTGTLATTLTSTANIVVRFQEADQPLGQRQEQDRWNVAPVDITIDSGVMTVSGPIWLIVKPTLYGRPGNAAINPTMPANFVQALDVFQVSADATQTATYMQNDIVIADAGHSAWHIEDARKGIIHFAPSCYEYPICYYQPTHITIRYRAGVTDGSWNDTICKLALAELSQRICGCEQANKEIQRWQQDRSMQGDDGRFQMRTSNVSNLLGTREGHIQAWNDILKRQQVRGISSLR